MLESVLIANRGEIAVRIIRSARRMGLRTIAVYSAADAAAQHVELADEAWPIGPADPAQSYLSIATIIDVARRSRAAAIHPGYGFLAENAEFARACEEAGIVFVGPTVEALEIMGSKAAAKRALTGTAVPVMPGYHGDDQSSERFAREALALGYPVLLKAAAGGGGKGMRIVATPEDLPAAIASAQREAQAAFGDPRLLLEKYLDRARHVEVQVFG
ncbi:MAG: biotin carboxylase N-terminal domain-containing protein, partial [Gammaproteobacteria bacterium]|nr:biotin carboxylase N-terminal domain-containing protein [Gammaproteobacteria bacterium]